MSCSGKEASREVWPHTYQPAQPRGRGAEPPAGVLRQPLWGIHQSRDRLLHPQGGILTWRWGQCPVLTLPAFKDRLSSQTKTGSK